LFPQGFLRKVYFRRVYYCRVFFTRSFSHYLFPQGFFLKRWISFRKRFTGIGKNGKIRMIFPARFVVWP
ncbi:MAG: hypothetical protein Q4D81_08780, partial [Eubacteriales bacterium]|nr:hypothetical protein [Eubacteriales bacterium]